MHRTGSRVFFEHQTNATGPTLNSELNEPPILPGEAMADIDPSIFLMSDADLLALLNHDDFFQDGKALAEDFTGQQDPIPHLDDTLFDPFFILRGIDEKDQTTRLPADPMPFPKSIHGMNTRHKNAPYTPKIDPTPSSEASSPSTVGGFFKQKPCKTSVRKNPDPNFSTCLKRKSSSQLDETSSHAALNGALKKPRKITLRTKRAHQKPSAQIDRSQRILDMNQELKKEVTLLKTQLATLIQEVMGKADDLNEFRNPTP